MNARGPDKKRRLRGGFTLVELLVVIGIIMILIGLLMPSTRKVVVNARAVECRSNMRQMGLHLLNYANSARGQLFPLGRGAPRPPWERWPVLVFPDLMRKPAPDPAPSSWPYEMEQEWTPKVMVCPADVEPVAAHSYVLNKHLSDRGVKFGTKNLAGKSPSEVVLAGEKVSQYDDYYMEIPKSPDGQPRESDFYRLVEMYRHGPAYGSNYLYLDWHVETIPPTELLRAVDPWDVPRETPH